MKKYLALILALAIVFTLCACGTTEKAADKSPAEIAEDYIGKDLNSLTAAIGEPQKSAYQDSCEMPDTQDGFLTYDGFTVVTVKNADGETVKRIDK